MRLNYNVSVIALSLIGLGILFYLIRTMDMYKACAAGSRFANTQAGVSITAEQNAKYAKLLNQRNQLSHQVNDLLQQVNQLQCNMSGSDGEVSDWEMCWHHSLLQLRWRSGAAGARRRSRRATGSTGHWPKHWPYF